MVAGIRESSPSVAPMPAPIVAMRVSVLVCSCLRMKVRSGSEGEVEYIKGGFGLSTRSGPLCYTSARPGVVSTRSFKVWRSRESATADFVVFHPSRAAHRRPQDSPCAAPRRLEVHQMILPLARISGASTVG
jgi:hypothetical protein